MAVLVVFLVIFLPTTLIAFTKLSFWRSFWWAKPIEILIGSNTTTWITIFVISFYFQFCKKKNWNFLTHKWPFYDHFWPFFGNYIKIFHKAEIQTVILRCFEGQNFNWIKSYNIISIKTIFFSCLKMHHFRASLPKWILTPPKEISSHIFKMVIFPKFFGAFMTQLIR